MARALKLPGYFDEETLASHDDVRLVRHYHPGDATSLIVHIGDLVCNLDMLLMAAKGHSTPKRVHYSPDMSRRKLVAARAYLEEIALRVEEAIEAS